MRRFTLAALAAALVATVTITAPVAAAPETKSVFIVQLADGANADNEAATAHAQGFAVGRIYRHVFAGFTVTATPTQAAALARNPRVVLVEADGTASASTTQDTATWGLDRIDQRNLPLSGTYSYDTDAAGVTAYIVDTGIRADHTQFGGRVAAGYTAFSDGNGTTDCNGHGTHVAGTVGGATFGVAKGVTLVPVRVLDCAGSGAWSGIIAGLDWIAARHVTGTPAVANMSLGGSASSTLDAAVNRVITKGVTVVVAAGNSTRDACQFSPSRVTAAVTVAAVDKTDRQASFSNYGKCVDLYAPGVGITSAWYLTSTYTNTISGTSMASPHVAGAAALLLAAAPAATPATVASTLTTNATSGAVLAASTGTPNKLLFTPSTPTTTPSEPVVTTPATAPSAPSNVTASAAKKAATVTWTLGADGGSALTGHVVRVYTGATYVGSVTVAGDATGVKIGGLRTGVTYTFGVIATNSVGSSSESVRSNPVTVT